MRSALIILGLCLVTTVVAQEPPITATIRCDKTTYFPGDDIIIDLVVSNGTDQMYEIGRMSPREIYADQIAFGIAGNRAAVALVENPLHRESLITEPLRPVVKSGKEFVNTPKTNSPQLHPSRIFIPPHSQREFNHVILRNAEWYNDIIKKHQGEYLVKWCFEKVNGFEKRPVSNTLKIRIEKAQQSAPDYSGAADGTLKPEP